jgi:hypothetical protein
MQSLPENVETIEKEANKIIGLDAEGRGVAEFDAATGEWIELAPVIDQATWDALKTEEERLALFPEVSENGYKMAELIGKSGFAAYRDKDGFLMEGMNYKGESVSKAELEKIMAQEARLRQDNSLVSDKIHSTDTNGTKVRGIHGLPVNPGVAEWRLVTDPSGVQYNLEGATVLTINPATGTEEEIFIRFRTYNASMKDLIPELTKWTMEPETMRAGIVYNFDYVEFADATWNNSPVTVTYRTIGKGTPELFQALRAGETVNIPDGFGLDIHDVEVAWSGY